MSLTDPHLTPLWKELHRRLSTGNPVATVRLTGLDEDQRHALSDLLGLPRLVDSNPRIRLDRLAAVLPVPVAEAVADILGPLGNKVLQRHQEQQARSALWQWFRAQPAIAGQPVLQNWAQQLPGTVTGPVAQVRNTLERLLAVLDVLPGDGIPLPKLADRTLGDPHALDSGRVAGLVLKAVARQLGRPDAEDAADRRALWEAVGIGCDAISTTVLVAGFSNHGSGPLADMVANWAAAGQACVVTLAQLRVTDVPVPATGRVVHVVENPSVLDMALRRFGTDCPPLVCTSGWPNSAGVRLLRSLAASGIALRYHGDFDPAGVHILGYLMDKTAARPWRMSATDYRSGLATLTHDGVRFRAGDVVDTPWDPELAAVMRDRRRALFEESLAGTLLDDLADRR